MKPIFVLLFFVTAGLITGVSASSAYAADASEKADYRVGDHLSSSSSPATAKTPYKEMKWETLVPADWDPSKAFKDLDMNALNDADPRATKFLQRLRDEWNNAPVDPKLNGARIRIPGFIVPLESQHNDVTEFLLVPYFGACIHVPPPPANQIIHVFPAKPVKNGQTMDAVWVSGVLETVRSDTNMGNSGYQLKAEMVTPYKPQRKK